MTLKKSLMMFVLLSAMWYAPLASALVPATVPHVMLDEYLGEWYEIGRLPMPFQNKCVAKVKATYTLKSSNTISIKNECLTHKGSTSVANGEAYVVDDTNAKLKVSFLPSFLKKLPFGRADYWVLALDGEGGSYQSALVGTPNQKYLWILSRDKTLGDDDYERYLQIAKQNGYDVRLFQKTVQ
ncbi:lipocalin family protein [Moraxella oculi]|uniref:Outer membrane lipoprotein Blc n=1 Tax=Moraxella oculi TaxID=2940516 RepID=A0ABW8UAK3_9GAMM